jgi:hypothetical protein
MMNFLSEVAGPPTPAWRSRQRDQKLVLASYDDLLTRFESTTGILPQELRKTDKQVRKAAGSIFAVRADSGIIRL